MYTFFVKPYVISKAKGNVAYGRVEGILAVTRAFGDFALKPSVSVKPFISRTVAKLMHKFLIVASDGLWDTVKEEVKLVLLTKLKQI